MSSSRMKFGPEKNIRTPSPTLHQVVFNQISRVKIYRFPMHFLKRISLFTSGNKRKRVRGSMTVEASLVLPLVLFFFLHLLSMPEMLRLHSKLTFGLWECGNTLAVYAAMPEEVSESVPDIAVSYLYVKNRLESFLGKEYLDTSPLAEGRTSLNFLASSYDEECVDIGVTYQVRPQFTLFPFPYMRLVNRYYAKAWTGYDNQKKDEFVYITIYGEVWHSRADCSHIFITIHETDWNKISQLRNEQGGKYYPCERCADKEKGESAYYTEKGDRYHRDRECPSLVRYIRAVIWQESIPYRPCSRCVGEEKKK